MSSNVIPWPSDPAGSPPDIPLGRPLDGPWLLPVPSTPTKLTSTDFGNGERLVLMYGEDLRYCHAFKTWLIFENGIWVPDRRDRALKMAGRTVCATMQQAVVFGSQDVQKFAARSLDDARLRAMLRQAQSALAISVGELDQHADLLAFRNGTVNLRTRELSAGKREDFLTKRVPHDYCPDAGCPLFLAFLNEIMGGGPDASEGQLEIADRLVDSLQRFFGYSITGDTSAKTVFVHIGVQGNNGKTTLLTLFRELLGDDHATLLSIDTLMRQRGGDSNNIKADLADLFGMRFVMTSEVEEGQRLSEAKLKLITTGNGQIKARRLYENPFVFVESHKLHVDSNHWPVIRAGDDPLWARLCCIPYNVRVPDERQDRMLRAKLRGEAQGILAWAVRGAQRFYEAGQRVPRPKEVQEATADYRLQMDSAGRFFQECCQFAEGLSTGSSALYDGYRTWSAANGEHPMSHKAFGERLKTREGVEVKHMRSGNVAFGIAVSDQSGTDLYGGEQ